MKPYSDENHPDLATYLTGFILALLLTLLAFGLVITGGADFSLGSIGKVPGIGENAQLVHHRWRYYSGDPANFGTPALFFAPEFRFVTKMESTGNPVRAIYYHHYGRRDFMDYE